jgi:general stress protein YciG
MQKSMHEKRVSAGEKGAEARWRSGGELSLSTRQKLSEAGKKGARAQPREAKVKGGERSRRRA